MPQQSEMSPIQSLMIQEFTELGQKLAEVSDVTYRVTQSEFAAKLLPILAGVGENFNIDAWESAIGNAYRPVVVHCDHTGATLYTIPALIRQLETSASLGERLNDHRNEMQNLQVDNPSQYSEIVYKAMSNTRGDDAPDAVSAKEMADVLVKIFTDYKMPIPEHLQSGNRGDDTIAPTSNAAPGADYERDYELP